MIFLPSAGLIVPERIFMGGAIGLHVCVGQTDILQCAVGGARLGLKQRVVDPHAGIIAVDLAGNDIVVAGNDEALFEVNRSCKWVCNAAMNGA